MILKLICWLWGHNFISQRATGEYHDQFHPLTGQTIQVPQIECAVSSFCFRCGCKNKDYMDKGCTK